MCVCKLFLIRNGGKNFFCFVSGRILLLLWPGCMAGAYDAPFCNFWPVRRERACCVPGARACHPGRTGGTLCMGATWSRACPGILRQPWASGPLIFFFFFFFFNGAVINFFFLNLLFFNFIYPLVPFFLLVYNSL